MVGNTLPYRRKFTHLNIDNAQFFGAQDQSVNIQQQKIQSQQKQQELAAKLDKAAKEVDCETLEELLDQNEHTFQKKDLNRALVSVVSGCSNQNKDYVFEIMTKLFMQGASVDFEDASTSKTALMIACEKGYIELVEKLIEYHAQVNYTGPKGNSTLHFAI